MAETRGATNRDQAGEGTERNLVVEGPGCVAVREEPRGPVPAGAFRPAPKVESAVARLVPLGDAAPPISDFPLFQRIVTAAFGQRRKTLRNALSGIATPAELEAAGIAPGARGETLTVDDFVRLCNGLAE